MRWLRKWLPCPARQRPRRTRARTFRPQLEELDARIAPATIDAAQTGLWSAGSTWVGGVAPTASDSAVIGSGINVTLNTNATIAGVTINNGGQLTFEPSMTRILSSSANVEVAGGILQMRPVSSSVTHELSFININEANFVGGGDVVLATDVGLWVTGAGKLDAIGADKTSWTHLGAAANAGATTITVDATGGWKVNDVIAIAPTMTPISNPGGTDISWEAYDQRTITAINGSVVTLNAALTYSHPVVNGTWYAEVLNLTRNVKIHGATSTSGRTHIAFTLTTQPQTVRNVEIYHTGPRKDKDADGVKDIIAGRYGFHMHHADNSSRGSLIEGVVVRDSGSHAFVTHDSHGVTYRGTVSHNTFETAYWWDYGAGNETNDVLYDGVVASKIRHSGSVVNAEPDGGKRTAGFWLGTGNGNTVINSVAVGVEGRQHVSSQTSGFLWPEATGDSIWTFNHNVSHNNGADGIFTWQNAPMPEHRIEDFVGYHNYQGIEHGAYTNRYQYRRLNLYGNVKAALNVHATSSSINNPLSFEDSIIDGGGLTSYAVYSPAHNANSDIAILFQNNTIRNLSPSGTAFYFDKGTLAEKGTGFKEWWTIRNNNIEGNPNLFWLRGSFSDKDGDAQIDYADTNGDGDINASDTGAGQTGGPEIFGVGTDTDIYVELSNGEAFRVRSKYFNFPNEGALPLVSAWNARKEAIRPVGTPIVEAGPNRTIFAPTNVVSLDGTVVDPPPSGTLSTTWTKVSGPGTVTFGNTALVDTTATFSAAGTYVLRLTANDGVNPAHFDQMTVYYNAANPSHTVTEAWTGANGAAWPALWTKELTGGSPLVEINTNRGHINSNGAAGSNGAIFVNTHNAENVDITAEFKVTGNRDSVGLIARRSDSDPDTYFLVEAAINEPVRIYFVLDGNKKVQAETTNEPVTTAWFKLRLLVQSNPDGTSNVLAKYWLTTASEPAAWSVQLKNWSLDSRMLGKSGRFGVYFKDKAGGSGAEVWYDNFTATTNMAPVVSAVAMGNSGTSSVMTASLDGAVTDDAITGPLTYSWTKITGPGTVTFGNAAAVDTTATFSAAGTYVLRLTANDGNRTGSADVTIKILSESFTAADGSPWPAAWTRQDVAGSAPAVNIQGNEGEVTNTGGGGFSDVMMVNNTAVAQDVDTSVKFRTNGVGAITSLFARRADTNANTFYKASIYVGTNNLSISKVVNGVSTSLAFTSFTLNPNTSYIMRFQVDTNAAGTTDLRVKVWDAAGAEPSAWTLTVLGDATAQLQGVAGRVGVAAAFIWTDNIRKIWFDDYVATLLV